MISCDTNVLFPACDTSSPQHKIARDFLEKYIDSQEFCLCEQVLMELYCLLRNPTVCRHPLSARNAVKVIHGFRSNPDWSIVDVVGDGDIMREVWGKASDANFAYRRIYDARLAATLQHHGVVEFVTRNLKDFKNIGFESVWDPFAN